MTPPLVALLVWLLGLALWLAAFALLWSSAEERPKPNGIALISVLGLVWPLVLVVGGVLLAIDWLITTLRPS